LELGKNCRVRWRKNIGAGANVGVHIKGIAYNAYAKAIPDDTDRKVQALKRRLGANPKAGILYGVSINSAGDPNEEEVLEFVTTNVKILMEINQPGSQASG
jgi:hypothetical protein